MFKGLKVEIQNNIGDIANAGQKKSGKDKVKNYQRIGLMMLKKLKIESEGITN